MNVIAFENDVAQYPYLKARLEVLAQKFTMSHGNWQKVCPEAFLGTVGGVHQPQVKRVDAKDEETQVDVEPEKPAAAPPKQSPDAPARKDLRICITCGLMVEPEKWVKCSSMVCDTVHHPECFENLNGDGTCSLCIAAQLAQA